MTERERFAEALSGVTYMSNDEKATYLEGATILLGLGWPLNFDYRMATRAIAGLVPKYEGLQSFFEYQAKWAKEDNDAAILLK